MPPEAIEDALVYIHANLDRAPSLGDVAGHVGLSPFHFQREFNRIVGQSPKAYTTRLRIERAAFRLLLHDDSVLQVGLDSGYASHETFTRAFRRHMGLSPSAFRSGDQAFSSSTDGNRRRSPLGARGFRLSATAIRELAPSHLACIRHVGPYEEVPEALYERLATWADAHGVASPRTYVGIGHDAPGAVDPRSLRYDAGVVVPSHAQLADDLTASALPGGTFAVTTHVGPFDTLPLAYRALFAQLGALADVDIIGLPVIEIYRTTQINVTAALNHTDIYVPVRKHS